MKIDVYPPPKLKRLMFIYFILQPNRITERN